MTRRPLALFIALSLAIPAGSIQGLASAPSTILPPAQAPDLLAVPAQYRPLILSTAQAAGIPPEILAGIAYAESSYRPAPAHIDPVDRGMFGLHESPAIRAERVAIHGEYDAENPVEAAPVAAGILAGHKARLGDWYTAVSAYRHGAAWTREHGIDWDYVEKVRRGV